MNKFFIRKEAKDVGQPSWWEKPLYAMDRLYGKITPGKIDRMYGKRGTVTKQFDPRDNPQQYAQDLYDMSEARTNRLKARRDTVMNHADKMRNIALNSGYVSPGDREYLDDLSHRSLKALSRVAESDIHRHNVIGEPGTIRRAVVEENIANRRPVNHAPRGPQRIWGNWNGLDEDRRNKR